MKNDFTGSIYFSGAWWTAAFCLFVIPSLLLPMAMSWSALWVPLVLVGLMSGARLLTGAYIRQLERRIEPPDTRKLSVCYQAQEVGRISEAELAILKLRVLRDTKTATAQVASILITVMDAVKNALRALPGLLGATCVLLVILLPGNVMAVYLVLRDGPITELAPFGIALKSLIVMLMLGSIVIRLIENKGACWSDPLNEGVNTILQVEYHTDSNAFSIRPVAEEKASFSADSVRRGVSMHQDGELKPEEAGLSAENIRSGVNFQKGGQ